MNVVSKLHAKHLSQVPRLDRDLEGIIQDEQARFREGKSTIDHILVLYHLVQKYTRKKNSSLFMAFLDFKHTFDSLSRNGKNKKYNY